MTKADATMARYDLCKMGFYETAWIKNTYDSGWLFTKSFTEWFNLYKVFAGLR